ncbi:MAG: hypothetical protein WD872_20515 [Pirellulaceae bacterium]
MKHAAGEHESELPPGHVEPRHDGCRGGHQLVGGAIQNACRNHITFVSRHLHVFGDRRH